MCTKAKPYDNWSIFGAKLHNMTADTLQYKQYKVGWMAQLHLHFFHLPFLGHKVPACVLPAAGTPSSWAAVAAREEVLW